MRTNANTIAGNFEARVISGTRTILIALNCPDAARKGLLGFAFERETVGAGGRGPKFLRSQKVFRSIVPNPKDARDPHDPTKPAAFYTNKFPVQSFLWGDYAAMPDTTYHFRILPMAHPQSVRQDRAEDREMVFEAKRRRRAKARMRARASKAGP